MQDIFYLYELTYCKVGILYKSMILRKGYAYICTWKTAIDLKFVIQLANYDLQVVIKEFLLKITFYKKGYQEDFVPN